MGAYTPGNPFDALIVGFYRGKDFLFAARVRAGSVPATRREVFAQIKGLKISKCPFVNLPETAPGRWGQGLTAEKMKSCIWVKPEVVVGIDFAEWTDADKLRHTKFCRLGGGVFFGRWTLRGTADPTLLLESRLQRVADFLGDLLSPAFNRTFAAFLPVHLHSSADDESCRVGGGN